mmetsp:Transcript_9184/g.23479  ORF Transcript_9184/g.23479 Transcript_9184/m.23479 type:complete len:360 (+) Transcript_9184:44-1123(+)
MVASSVDARALRRRCVAAMSAEEHKFRPDMDGLRDFFAGAGTMNQSQREHVVQFITEVCEDYGFAGQTAWTAVNYFDRFLGKAIQTPKRRIELVSLSCLLVAAKFLECRSPSLEDLCTLSQNRLTKEDFMRFELKVLAQLEWQLAVPSPHAFLFHTVHMMSTHCQGHALQGRLQLLLKRAEFFVDLSAFEYSFLNLPLGTIAGAAFVCALRQLRLDHKLDDMGEVEEELCSLLDCEQPVLFSSAETLMGCYYSCIAAEEDSHALAAPSSSVVFEPIKAGAADESAEPRSESPDSIMTSAMALATKPAAPPAEQATAGRPGKSKASAPRAPSPPPMRSVSETFRGRSMLQQERSKRSRTS